MVGPHYAGNNLKLSTVVGYMAIQLCLMPCRPIIPPARHSLIRFLNADIYWNLVEV